MLLKGESRWSRLGIEKAAEQGNEDAKEALAKKYGIDEFRMEELIEEAFE